MAAAVTALALAGCSGADSSETLALHEQGEILGSAALSATPSPSPTATPAPDDYSMNSGWVSVAGCPAGVFAGISEGFAGHGSITQTVPSTSSGPSSLPGLTSKFVPSCSFKFSDSNGINGTGEIFFGMGVNYQKLFAGGVLSAGYTLRQTSNYTSAYVRGVSVIGIEYIPADTDGDPYSAVAVFGTNS
jgi:hypothetical protein